MTCGLPRLLQLVAKGILPDESEAPEVPPTAASMDSALLGTSLDLSSASVLSGASLAVLQRLADRLTEGIARRCAPEEENEEEEEQCTLFHQTLQGASWGRDWLAVRWWLSAACSGMLHTASGQAVRPLARVAGLADGADASGRPHHCSACLVDQGPRKHRPLKSQHAPVLQRLQPCTLERFRPLPDLPVYPRRPALGAMSCELYGHVDPSTVRCHAGLLADRQMARQLREPHSLPRLVLEPGLGPSRPGLPRQLGSAAC